MVMKVSALTSVQQLFESKHEYMMEKNISEELKDSLNTARYLLITANCY